MEPNRSGVDWIGDHFKFEGRISQPLTSVSSRQGRPGVQTKWIMLQSNKAPIIRLKKSVSKNDDWQSNSHFDHEVHIHYHNTT